MADGKFTADGATRLRKANEIIMSMKHLKPPDKLFDEFWREGELAMLFGPRATGKSILAVQIAEAIARGHVIDGFEMSEKRHKVLYVDLKLSERQFDLRYAGAEKQYKFSENLYRNRPKAGEDIAKWLRTMITENGFRVIVIDDLSAVSMTFDGTRETLKLMRELKQLKDDLDVSILVLAGSQEQRKGEAISETHMMRSRILCDAADSVFALGRHFGNPQFRYLIQTRSQSAAIKWQANNGPMCTIKTSDEGLLEMAFDERFVAEIDEETRDLICNIKSRRDAGATYRCIADELGIPKSTAFRLHRKWTPGLEKDYVVESESPAVASGLTSESSAVEEKEEWEECGFEKPTWLDESEPPASAGSNGVGMDASLPSNADVADGQSSLPPAHAGGSDKIAITDLKRALDGYGREIFIEEEQPHDGKPIVWYQYDSKGKLIQKKRSLYGVSIKRIETPWVSPTRLETEV